MSEQWKQIAGYDGRYEVSNYGRIRSFVYCSNGRLAKITSNGPGDYDVVHLSQGAGGGSKLHRIHRLVATAFIPNPENKPEVNHIDGIRANNRDDNLEWATRLENQHHAIRNGLVDHRGEKHPRAQISNLGARVIRRCEELGTMKHLEIAAVFGVKVGTVNRIKHGKNWAYSTVPCGTG